MAKAVKTITIHDDDTVSIFDEETEQMVTDLSGKEVLLLGDTIMGSLETDNYGQVLFYTGLKEDGSEFNPDEVLEASEG